MNTVKKGDLSILGEKVKVKIDRPIGAEHPKHPGLIYPINYGYIEGLYAGDGEEQDVYILGVEEKIEEFCGTVIAVICRENDNEDKWVAVPDSMVGQPICYECNVEKAVEFQEKYYTHTFYPRFEKTCGSVMYTERDGERLYLLIKNESGHIGFPKGHVEYGESETETALREVFEETGLTCVPERNFRKEYTYHTLDDTYKTGVFFLSHYDYIQAKFQQEEILDDWLLPYEKAMEKLNFPQDREILAAAEEVLRGD